MADFTFGDFRFDPEGLLLYRHGAPLPLGRPAALLLAALLAGRGKVICKDALLQAAWGDRALEVSNLSVQIAALRRLLGKTDTGGEWIMTVARVGYRFLPGTGPDTVAPAITRLPSIALLPFADLGPGDSGRGQVDALADDLVTALARFRSLRVLSPNLGLGEHSRAGDVRAIAGELGVDYLLEASLRRNGQSRLNVRLVEGDTGAQLWSEAFVAATEEELADLTGTISAAVDCQVHLAELAKSRRRSPDSITAYDFYLRGEEGVLTSRVLENERAFGFYLRAIELEPDNPLFIGAAAGALHHRISVGWQSLGPDDRAAARELARKALECTEPDAGSLGLIGNALFTSGEEDLGAAITERALELNTESPLALICMALAARWQGRFEVAERHLMHTITLTKGDPNRRFALASLAALRLIQGRPEESLSFAQRAAAIAPALSVANWHIIAAEQALGNRDGAKRAVERYMRVAPGVTIRSIDAGQPYANREYLRPVLGGMAAAGVPLR